MEAKGMSTYLGWEVIDLWRGNGICEEATEEEVKEGAVLIYVSWWFLNRRSWRHPGDLYLCWRGRPEWMEGKRRSYQHREGTYICAFLSNLSIYLPLPKWTLTRR